MQPEKVLTDDTETMMSQVYSSPSKSKVLQTFFIA